MECLVLGVDWQGALAQLCLESVDDRWRCTWIASPATALERIMADAPDALLICNAADASLLDALSTLPPVRAPWVVTEQWTHAISDLTLSLDRLGELPALVDAWECGGLLPRLAQARLPMLQALSAYQLRSLGVPAGLRAWEFLPDMTALCTVHPALMDDLRHRLYPLIGRRCHLTPTCVERRLRLAVESTWNRSPVEVLEGYFGQSIDPERGKPTNKEFLCRMQERVALDALRQRLPV